MNISFKMAIDAVMLVCFGVSFISFSIIPTKLDILGPTHKRHMSLIRLGFLFFSLGASILLLQTVFGL